MPACKASASYVPLAGKPAQQPIMPFMLWNSHLEGKRTFLAAAAAAAYLF